ncbi:MAG: hypothetical protein ACR2HG_06960 [Pyrinomonadaceae bacterium]
MNAHRMETVVQSNGSVTLNNLPFKEGEAVEIIVLQAEVKTKNSVSLRGNLLKYEEPFESVAAEDWEISK